MNMDEMRRAIVQDILDTHDHNEIKRAVEEYVEGFTDESIIEMYKDVAR